MNEKLDLKSMSVEQLWSFHEKLAAILIAKIKTEKAAVENRLIILNEGSNQSAGVVRKVKATRSSGRRPYPLVVPKFRNPSKKSETWSGRGHQPRWLKAQLDAGRTIDDFRI